MSISTNANIKLLKGGSFTGGSNWDKSADDIDNCFKIYYFRDGRSEITSCNKTFSLSSGNLYFINGYSIVSQRCPHNMSVDWIHFIPESLYLNHLLKFCSCVVELDISEFASFIKIFNQFQAYFDYTIPESTYRILQLEIQSFVQLALARAFKSLDQSIFETDEAVIRLLPILEFITEHYQDKISLREIATQHHLSPNYFHRLFTKAFHISPHSYILRMRMEEATRQLVYTAKSVKEIAHITGYEDEAYFSRVFNKFFKASPGKYRTASRRRLP